MPEVEVKNLENEVVEKLALEDAVFDYSASQTLLWEAVRAFRASRRKGTHATRNRAAIRASGRKPWRQKGTGRARVGSVSSPLWRKGGITFGPSPRDYSQSFPKKKRRGAIKLALTDKLKNERLVVVQELSLASHRTKEFLQVLQRLQLDTKVLVVDDRDNRDLYLGARNLPRVKMVPTRGLNVYDLLNHEHLLISKKAVLEVQEGLQR
jgi:large subunit ribosomal protein L4